MEKSISVKGEQHMVVKVEKGAHEEETQVEKVYETKSLGYYDVIKERSAKGLRRVKHILVICFAVISALELTSNRPCACNLVLCRIQNRRQGVVEKEPIDIGDKPIQFKVLSTTVPLL
ncbi:hypothetical protein Tco_0625290 [Tanacetum coccineum]|uniref:Uncharacterized protein n=1 Tax=Tanacetum coccineum TaxID=301880 RepID=A0ABQ4WGD8_9ASTR